MTTSHTLLAGRPAMAALERWQQAVADGERAAAALAESSSGEFAVGVRDTARGRTFLAVDRFAVRTLCYRLYEGNLEFAQRADDLADNNLELDEQSLFDYLFFHCIPSPRTVFKGVRRLPPGHYAWYEGGKLTVAPYWLPRFTEPARPAALVALKAEFRQLLFRAVERELDPVSPACFLSGGTDSSTVAGMIGQVTELPARSYSIGFEAEGYDEMAYARLASHHFKTDHHEYYVTPDDLVSAIPTVAGHYDQPFGNSSALPAYYCAKMAHDDGVTRLLAGDGGDELFGGNSRYAKQRVFSLYGLLPGAVRRHVIESLLERTSLGSLPGLKKARSYVEQAKVPMPDRLQMYNLLLRLGVEEVMEPSFLSLVDREGPAKLQRDIWDLIPGTQELNRTLAYDWRFTLADSDLPKVRGTAALAGIEVGFPLLDRQLLEFSLKLPVAYKLKGLKLRWFFKEALRGFLPDEIITKSKHGFGLPFGAWAIRHHPLHRLAADSLDSLAERGIVKRAFIRQLLDQRMPEFPGYYGEMVWVLMMLEQWLQQHRPGARFS